PSPAPASSATASPTGTRASVKPARTPGPRSTSSTGTTEPVTAHLRAPRSRVLQEVREVEVVLAPASGRVLEDLRDLDRTRRGRGLGVVRSPGPLILARLPVVGEERGHRDVR